MKKDDRYNSIALSDNLGKIPPQAVDIEEAVIGALMIEKEAVDQVYTLLRPETFYKEANQIIYSAIVQLYQENSPIDILTVTNQLSKTNQLDTVGGPLYITQLTGKVASAAHIETHAKIIAQQHFKREMIRSSTVLQQLSFDESTEVDDLMDYASKVFLEMSEMIFGKKRNKPFIEVVNQSVDRVYARKALFEKGEVSGIKTSVRNLTRITGGWQDTDYIIVGARPSMGKTAFVLSEALAASENNTDVAIFSLEMEDVRLADRIICGVANVDTERFRVGNLSDNEMMKIEEAAGMICKRSIYIDDSSNPTIHYIKNRAKILKRKTDEHNRNRKPDQPERKFMVMIDYLQLLEAVHDKGKNREQEVAEISKAAKGIAKELHCPVIMLAQLNRSCDLRADKRPMLSDLRESGAIEQDADIVMFIYRDWYYKIYEDEEGNSTKGKGELIIAKHRNGPTGPVFFGHNEGLTRIYDYQGAENSLTPPRDVTNRSFYEKDDSEEDVF